MNYRQRFGLCLFILIMVYLPTLEGIGITIFIILAGISGTMFILGEDKK